MWPFSTKIYSDSIPLRSGLVQRFTSRIESLANSRTGLTYSCTVSMAGWSEQKVKGMNKDCSSLVWWCVVSIFLSNSTKTQHPRPPPRLLSIDRNLACMPFLHGAPRDSAIVRLSSYRMESVPVDVATLSELSESSILSCLEERFSNQHFQVDRWDSITLFMYRGCMRHE